MIISDYLGLSRKKDIKCITHVSRLSRISGSCERDDNGARFIIRANRNDNVRGPRRTSLYRGVSRVVTRGE